MRSFSTILLLLITGLIISTNSCKREDKALPIADYKYTYSNECSIPSEVNFENLSFEASVFRWDFGDGTPPVYEKNPTHMYEQEGIYNVELTAYGNGGMHNEVKAIYIVTNPSIDFSVSDSVIFVNDSVQCFGQASTGVLPSAWFWTFGDGGTSNLQNSSHKYSSPGIYDVTLTAINACGSSYIEKKKHIHVNSVGVPPIADFTANNLTINVGQTINFTDLSVNNANSWTWTFHGGSPGNSNTQNPNNIQYNSPGNYDVTLNVTNSFGANSLTKTGYIHVLSSPPTTVYIKKIIIKQMNFPNMPPYFVNLFYKISDTSPYNLLLDGTMQIINGLVQVELPETWTLNPYFQVPNINHLFRIDLFDKKGMPPQDLPVGFVQFNMANYSNYPSIVTLSQNGITMDLELQWQ